MSACDREQLLLLAAGELEPTRADDVQRHLAECPRCAVELERLRADLSRLEALPVLEPSAAAARRIVARGRQALARRKPVRYSLVYRYRHALAVAAALLLAFGLSLFNSPTPTGPTQQQLDQLWEESGSELTDSGEMVEDLAEQYAANPWTEAANTVIAKFGQSDLNDALMEMEEHLELIEGLAWDS